LRGDIPYRIVLKRTKKHGQYGQKLIHFPKNIIISTKPIVSARQPSVNNFYTEIYESPGNGLIADTRSHRNGWKNRRGRHIGYPL